MRWKQAMQILAPAIDRKSCLHILQNIRIAPEFLEATDLEYSVRIAMPRHGMNCTKDGFTIGFDDVKSLVDPDFIKGDEEIAVIDGESKQRIGFRSWEEYPMLPFEQKSKKWITLSLVDLVDALSAVIPHIDPRNMRVILSAANFRVEKGELSICGTDKHSLGLWKQKVEAEDMEFCLADPGKLLKSLKVIQKVYPGFEEVYIGLPEPNKEGQYGNVSFNFPSAPVAILVRLVEGKYPDYDQAIPQNWEAEINVDLKQIREEMKKQHGKFCKMREPILFVEITDKYLRLSMDEEELKFGREFCLRGITARKGYELKTAYDPLHFERCLSSLKGSTVEMRFLDKNSPAVLYGEEERLTVVLMPLRIKDVAEEKEDFPYDEDNIPF